MSRGYFIVIMLLAIMMGVSSAMAEGLIEVTASVDKQTAYIGDLIEYSVIITHDSTLQITPPPAGANLGGFEVKDYEFGEEEITADGQIEQAYQFSLRTFTTGDYVIPGLPIEYMFPDSTVKYISADPIKITIKSLLAEGVSADSIQVKPLKGQVSLARSRATVWGFIIAGVAIIGVALWYFIWRKKQPKEEIAYVDPRPSWEIAYADLAMLKDKKLPENNKVKQFYFELSEIIKKYVGKKCGFDAIEMTTTEVDDELSEFDVPEEFGAELMTFMDHADLVKFAKYIPAVDRPDDDWNTAYNLITSSKDIAVRHNFPAMPEPVMVARGDRPDDEDDSELRFCPPELRDYFASQEKEDNL